MLFRSLNWINRHKMLELGPEKRALLTEQLRRDTEFLKKVNVMDYSLLVGIHNIQRGNKEKLRKNTLKVFSVCIAHLIICSSYPDYSLSLISQSQELDVPSPHPPSVPFRPKP